MLEIILERNSWLICKLGMPLVFFYHLLISNVFWNTAAEDAVGLEWAANTALAPMHYFFEGKKAIPVRNEDGTLSYVLERRFSYDDHFHVKIASSVALLPVSIAAGGVLKGCAYLFPSTKERAMKIAAAVDSRELHSNLAYYESVGIELGDYVEAEFIDEPKFKKHPLAKHRLAADLKALEEISRILQKHNIPFWLDCGSCLGAYQYGGAIPHDWDIDIGVLLPDFENLKNALHELDKKKYAVQDWSGRARPNSYLKVFIRESGGVIDLYHFQVNEKEKTINTFLSNEFNIFLPDQWRVREIRYCVPISFENVFPLKKALFEGIEVPVPGNIVAYLQTFYGENLAPAKLYNEVTGIYEKDLDHPYWQLPHAH